MLPLLTATVIVIFSQHTTETMEVELTQHDLDESSEAKDNLEHLNEVWVEDAARIKLEAQLKDASTQFMATALLDYEKVGTILIVDVDADLGRHTQHYSTELTPEDLTDAAPEATSLDEIDDETIFQVAKDIVLSQNLSGYDEETIKFKFSFER